jgi:NOL1/NOP2/sun family putative RNA methylase
MRQLPPEFLNRMQNILETEFRAFKNELENGERQYGIRVNNLKITRDALAQELRLSEFIPWSDTGLYATREARLGAHPLHHAGAYYVQEPSAQAVANALEIQPNMRVLDLCAAPGGKSTHIAALMQNQGVLVCNEISATRAKALAENLERLGCIGIVTNEEPTKLAQKWGATFDRILVDAPCSGEGMFRKHNAAIESWSEAHVKTCAVRQNAILENATTMLVAGGILVYSTCTFAEEENENVITAFLEQHPEFILETIEGFNAGIGGVGSRLYPHLIRGEGHFLARLRKTDGARQGEASDHAREVRVYGQESLAPTVGNVDIVSTVKDKKILLEFAREFGLPDGIALEYRGEIQIAHPRSPSLEGIRALRAGVPVAHIEKNRLEPHHALSRVITGFANTVTLENSEVSAYLRGETITRAGNSGWVLLETNGFALGWGKRVGSVIKNHYPKHLRGNAVLLED